MSGLPMTLTSPQPSGPGSWKRRNRPHSPPTHYCVHLLFQVSLTVRGMRLAYSVTRMACTKPARGTGRVAQPSAWTEKGRGYSGCRQRPGSRIPSVYVCTGYVSTVVAGIRVFRDLEKGHYTQMTFVFVLVSASVVVKRHHNHSNSYKENT